MSDPTDKMHPIPHARRGVAPRVWDEPPHDHDPQVEVAASFCVYQERILLLKYAKGRVEQGLWVIPSGKVQEGESIDDTMVRELEEEVGVKVTSTNLIYRGPVFARKARYDYIVHHYIYRPRREMEISLSDEHDAYRWMTLDEANQERCIPNFAAFVEMVFEKPLINLCG